MKLGLSANTEKQPVEVESVTDWKDSVKQGRRKQLFYLQSTGTTRHNA